MGMDWYKHRVITPTSSTPTTVYNMTVLPPPLFCFPNFSLSSPTMSLLGVTVCLCVSVETFDCFHFGGESFVVFLFCFYFVKLMIHIVLEPPATIKTVKSYSCSYYFIFHFLLICDTMQVADKITWRFKHCRWRTLYFTIPIYKLYIII